MVPGAGGSRVILNTREVDAIPTQTFLGLSKETQTRLVNEAREVRAELERAKEAA